MNEDWKQSPEADRLRIAIGRIGALRYNKRRLIDAARLLEDLADFAEGYKSGRTFH